MYINIHVNLIKSHHVLHFDDGGVNVKCVLDRDDILKDNNR